MNDPTAETWRPVVGYEGYFEVSDLGRVRSLPRIYLNSGRARRLRGKVLKTQTEPKGYQRIRLVRDGVGWTTSVHKLVLTAFIGPRPDGMVCRHLDGDPANNTPQNLEWGTPSENKLDQVRHGTDAHASKTHCKKGHPFDAINTYTYPRADGGVGRGCRTCRNEATKRSQRRRRQRGRELAYIQ